MPLVSPIPTADICDRLETVSDAVVIVHPLFQNFGARQSFAGRITTVSCINDNSKVREQVSRHGDNGVLVVDGGASYHCALLGGNLAAMAAANAWSGIVINGCVRDCDEIKNIDIGVRALCAMPRRSEKRDGGRVDIPLYFANAAFIPGHYLYADSDGMIVSADIL